MRHPSPQIVLRKIGGRFDACWRGAGRSAAFATGAAPRRGGTLGAFCALLLLPLLALAVLAALVTVGHAPHVAHLALSPLALGGLVAGETADVSKLVGDLNTAFVNFKANNDARLAEIEKTGTASAELSAKVDRWNDEISAIEDKLKAVETAQARIHAGGALNAEEIRNERTVAAQFFSHVRNERVKIADISDAQLETVRNYRDAFDVYMRRGGDNMSTDIRNALSVGSSPDGGYWVLPDTSGRIVQLVYESSPMRQIADVQPIGTDALEGQYDNDEIAMGGWVSEGGPRNTETATPTTGKWRIEAAEMWALPRTTQKNLDDSQQDVEGWLTRKSSDKFARYENTAFVLGDGVGKPRGVLSYASAVPTKQNFGVVEQKKTGVNGAFPASSPGDFLIDLLSLLKAPYRQNATWIMTRLTKAAVRKLKDGQGNYLWQRDFTAAGGETPLLGYPVQEFADMPELAANGLSIGVGDFKQAYQIVDRMGIRVLRNPFTQMGSVLFYTTRRVGGGIVNGEAIKLGNFHT